MCVFACVCVYVCVIFLCLIAYKLSWVMIRWCLLGLLCCRKITGERESIAKRSRKLEKPVMTFDLEDLEPEVSMKFYGIEKFPVDRLSLEHYRYLGETKVKNSLGQTAKLVNADDNKGSMGPNKHTRFSTVSLPFLCLTS